MFCPGWDQDRGTEREENWWIVSQHSAFVSAPWRQRDSPSPPLKKKSCLSGTVHAALVSPGWTVPSNFKWGEWAVTKTGEKKGANRWQHTARSKKRYVLVKNKHVWCLSGALQQKGEKKKCLFFSIIIQTCSTKTTNHIHKPLIGTVYLSENIIEPKNKKSCFFFF